MTSTEDRDPEYGGPFIIPAEAPDEMGVTTEQAARALAHVGFDVKQATAYFRNRVMAGQVTPCGRVAKEDDGRQPYLFKSDQVLIAAILHRLAESGLIGDPLQEAHRVLSAWNLDEVPNPPAPTPASWVFRAYMAGQRNFGFELITVRNTQFRGDVKFAARVRQFNLDTKEAVGTSFLMPGPTWERRSVWATDLDPILAHITRNKGDH